MINREVIQHFSFQKLAECGKYSSLSYYISYKEFENMFEENKSFNRKLDEMTEEDYGLFYTDFMAALYALSFNSDGKIIKLFLKLHVHYLPYEIYQRGKVNDFVINMISHNHSIDTEISQMIENSLI